MNCTIIRVSVLSNIPEHATTLETRVVNVRPQFRQRRCVPRNLITKRQSSIRETKESKTRDRGQPPTKKRFLIQQIFTGRQRTGPLKFHKWKPATMTGIGRERPNQHNAVRSKVAQRQRSADERETGIASGTERRGRIIKATLINC